MRKKWLRYCLVYFGVAASFPSLFFSVFAQNNCREAPSTNLNDLLVVTRYSNGIGKNGFVDETGKTIIEAKYDEAYTFSDGLALVRTGEKYGFVDREGKEIIKPQFENACPFSEGLASVKINGKYGYIDKEGKPIIRPQFDNAYNFSEGLARIKIYTKVELAQDIVEDQYGYVDKSGKLVIPANFDGASDFHGGVAKVIDSIFGLETYIDKNGKIISHKSNIPIEVFGAAPNLIEVKIESSPVGARVYLIPKRRLELDSALINKDEGGLYEFLVPTGATPTKFKAKQKQYTVLFVLNGARKQTPLDVRPDGSNSASVNFP